MASIPELLLHSSIVCRCQTDSGSDVCPTFTGDLHVFLRKLDVRCPPIIGQVTLQNNGKGMRSLSEHLNTPLPPFRGLSENGIAVLVTGNFVKSAQASQKETQMGSFSTFRSQKRR